MGRERELAKNTLILTIGKISTQCVQFLMLPLYTALLVPEEYGVVDLFNTYVILLVPLVNLQFDRGLYRFLLDCRLKFEEQKKIFTTVLISNFLQINFYLLFFFIVQKFIHSEYKVFLAIDVVANIILSTLLQFSRGIGKNRKYAFASFLSTSLTVILNVVFIVIVKMGALGMFLAVCTSKFITITFLVSTLKVWNYFSFKQRSFVIFRDILRYSLPLVPNALAWWVIGASDRSIISYVLGVAVNGIYSVANKFSAVFITFYNVFDMSWTEMVSRHIDDDDRTEFLTNITNQMFRLFSSICLGIVAVMPFMFSIIVNNQYSDAYYQIPILMMAVLFQVVVGLYSAFYVALKKTVEIAKTSMIAAIINIVTNVFLISKIHLYAASLSTLIAYLSMAIYRYFHVKKYIDIKLEINSIISTVVISIIVTFSYYYGNILFQVISFILVITYSLIVNYTLIKTVVASLIFKINKLDN